MAASYSCNPEPLKQALAGTLSPQHLHSLEKHLESCRVCREGLERIAAEPVDWAKLSDYFSASILSNNSGVWRPTVEVNLHSDHLRSSRYEVVTVGTLESLPVESASLEPASHPELLGRIDGFEIEQVLGRGGMGIVYKGFDRELNRPVAIKVLADHLAASGVARQRFAREAQSAAAVIHPNVVPIHSVNSSAARPYLVMTLVAGRSLQAHVTERGPLAVKEMVRIAQQIAAGLAAAHRQGLVHRDIKPANILLEKDISRVMITDFGLARAANDMAITQTGWLAGTPHYMSPEQSDGREIDQRSDLFSLGSVMYFMATGREPFRASIPLAILPKIIEQPHASVRSINSDVTKTLSRIIDRLMQKNPDRRFQTAEEVETILTQYLAHLEQPRTQPEPRIRDAHSNRKYAWALFASVLLMLACLIGWRVWQPTSDAGRSTPETAQNSGHLSSDAMMFGLQSPNEWQRHLNDLEVDILRLESSPAHNPVSDWMNRELTAIETELLLLEQYLGDSK